MSEFSCPVVRVTIEPHPNAEAIEIARIGDYQSIVKKGQFASGELAVYIPEQAVLPEWLLKKMSLWDDVRNKGGLGGSLGNRVKAIRLRGIVSQGLVLDGANLEGRLILTAPNLVAGTASSQFLGFAEGEDSAEFLGVVKYDPPIPSHLVGKIAGMDQGATLGYDFENLKKRPDIFTEGEPVVITEKIHGTLMQIGVVPANMANDRFYKGRVTISSKGMGRQGFVLDHTDDTNLYVQAAKKHDLFEQALAYFGDAANDVDQPYFVIGEVFGLTASGAGVQDLTYNKEVLGFRMFDVCCGTRGKEEYFDLESFEDAAHSMKQEMVPVLFVGEYSKARVLELTDGNTVVQPKLTRNVVQQIREGVVVKSTNESRHPTYGRKIAKSVSNAYLMRRGEVTEFN
jgi:RNA ligase (TIGR02306 family)